MFERILKEMESDHPYFSSNIPHNAVLWQELQTALLSAVKRKGLFFYTYSSAKHGNDLYAISDDYDPEPSLTYNLLHDPTAPIG